MSSNPIEFFTTIEGGTWYTWDMYPAWGDGRIAAIKYKNGQIFDIQPSGRFKYREPMVQEKRDTYRSTPAFNSGADFFAYLRTADTSDNQKQQQNNNNKTARQNLADMVPADSYKFVERPVLEYCLVTFESLIKNYSAKSWDLQDFTNINVAIYHLRIALGKYSTTLQHNGTSVVVCEKYHSRVWKGSCSNCGNSWEQHQ